MFFAGNRKILRTRKVQEISGECFWYGMKILSCLWQDLASLLDAPGVGHHLNLGNVMN